MSENAKMPVKWGGVEVSEETPSEAAVDAGVLRVIG